MPVSFVPGPKGPRTRRFLLERSTKMGTTREITTRQLDLAKGVEPLEAISVLEVGQRQSF